MTLGRSLRLDNILPLHLCDIAAMTYFWGIAATVQALLTPALGLGFPSWPFITFFIQLFAIVGAALYLPVADGWGRSIRCGATRCASMAGRSLTSRSLWASTRGSTPTSASPPSLIDHFGPWPWYLFSLQAIGIVLFLLFAYPLRRRR